MVLVLRWVSNLVRVYPHLGQHFLDDPVLAYYLSSVLL